MAEVGPDYGRSLDCGRLRRRRSRRGARLVCRPPFAESRSENGTVYAEDIQPEMIEYIRRRIQNERLRNVVTILGTPTDPRLPEGIDAALIVDTYPEIDDPVALLKNVAAVLKPQGRIGIVDFGLGQGGPGPDRPEERVAPETVIQAASAAGLKLIANEPVGPFQFLLIFKN